ncbi:MAG: hypothetical protein IK045_00845 [Bacteroidales bacterium]|nr:hypothetical protein [Bacteroidales bacterium]
MKNRYIYALLAALAILSCSKQAGSRSDTPSAADELMTFKADLGSSKSYFQDIENPTLYWSSYDDIAVYGGYVGTLATATQELNQYARGLNVGDPLEKYLVGAYGTLTSSESTATRIITNRTRGDFVNAINDEAEDDDLFIFSAIYPANRSAEKTAKNFVKFWEGEVEEEVKTIYGIPCEVATKQIATEGIGRYHICVDHGFNLDNPDRVYGCITKKQILDGEEVVFNHFTPATSIIMFTVQSSDGEYYNLNRIRIIVEDAVALTGECYLCSQHATADILFYADEDDVCNYVDIKLNTLQVTPFENTNYVMAVVMPSYASGFPEVRATELQAWPCNKYTDSRVVFYGYDTDDKLVLKGEKTAPANGFVAGGRYRTSVTLYPANLDTGTNGDGPGSYQDGSGTFEQL